MPYFNFNSLRRGIGGAIAPLVLLLSPIAAHPATVTLTPSADTTLIETAPNSSMGGHEFFNAGSTMTRTRNRGLIQFDLDGVIPPGSVIESATVHLTVVFLPPSPAPSLFGLHRVLQPWGEGDTLPENVNFPGLGNMAELNDATWNDRFFGTGQPWSSPGGAENVDYFGNASSVEFIESEDTYLFDATSRLIADVQTWVDDPEVNHGWMLKSFSEETAFTARRWASREDPFFPPLLTVTYTPVPEPRIWALAAGPLLLLALRTLRSRSMAP